MNVYHWVEGPHGELIFELWYILNKDDVELHSQWKYKEPVEANFYPMGEPKKVICISDHINIAVLSTIEKFDNQNRARCSIDPTDVKEQREELIKKHVKAGEKPPDVHTTPPRHDAWTPKVHTEWITAFTLKLKGFKLKLFHNSDIRSMP